MSRLIAASALLVALATSPLLAQDDELVGTWEQIIEPEEGVTDISARLTLRVDQTFEIVAEGHFDREFLDPDEGDTSFDIGDDELPNVPLFPDGFTLKFVVRGPWEAEDGELTLHFEDVEITFDDLPVDEFIVAAAHKLAAQLAEDQGIADDEYAAFEEAVVTLFLLQEDPNEFEEPFRQDAGDEDVNAYEVDGDSMFFFEDEEVAAEFRRVTVSVVSALGWGQLKSAPILRQP